jgi:acyl-CoA dehydrogenase
LAVTADVGLLVMGGKLKMRELLSARLGDVLSQLFIASSILKYHTSLPNDVNNDLHADYALRIAFVKAQRALLGFYENFPVRWLAWLLKHLAFPLRMPVQHAPDQMVRDLGNAIMETTEVRAALSECCYQSSDEHDALGRLEITFQLLLEIEAPLQALRKARRKGEIGGDSFAEQLAAAVAKGIVAVADQHKLSEYERLRHECLLTDVFDRELRELRGAA